MISDRPPRCTCRRNAAVSASAWLVEQDLPADERAAATALLRQLDFHAEELALIDRDLAQVALGRDDVRRLMTIPGVDATVALSRVAAVGDFTRFRTSDRLVSYFGLNPKVRQSGNQPSAHGRITKAGPGYARGMLVEAAFSTSKAPGPLRAFYQQVRTRRGTHVAIVATARKLTVLCWHLTIKGEDYAYAMPSLLAQKQRRLELRAGQPAKRGRRGTAAAYSLREVRAAERQLAAQSEAAYRTMVANWRPQPSGRPRAAAPPAGGSGRGRQHRDTASTPHG